MYILKKRVLDITCQICFNWMASSTYLQPTRKRLPIQQCFQINCDNLVCFQIFFANEQKYRTSSHDNLYVLQKIVFSLLLCTYIHATRKNICLQKLSYYYKSIFYLTFKILWSIWTIKDTGKFFHWFLHQNNHILNTILSSTLQCNFCYW